MTSLFKGMPGAKEWRNLSGGIESKKSSAEDLVRSMQLFVEDRVYSALSASMTLACSSSNFSGSLSSYSPKYSLIPAISSNHF